MRLRFKQFLKEAPIGDYQTHGNWEKNSSFRDPRDRMLIQNSKTIEHVKKKFGNSPYTWNLHFVNSPKANKHTEEGKVSLDWVAQNLGEDVAKAVAESNAKDNDSINLIFTNNKGAERKNMTAWIMAHRIGHAMARGQGRRDNQAYKEASNHLISQLSQIMQYYGQNDFPESEDQLTGNYRLNSRESSRKKQLAMLYFFFDVATFKSARDRNIRDWFEVLNELVAQYITTGHIKFNNAPQSFGNKGGKNSMRFHTNDPGEVTDMLHTLARDMEYMIDNILSNAVGSIYVM